MFIEADEKSDIDDANTKKDNVVATPSPPSPSSAKLIDNRIPNAVTEVPSIEVPTKFEGLLDDPTIVFKSSTGTENRVNAKVIRRLKDKKTAMDRAREMLRNRLNGKLHLKHTLKACDEFDGGVFCFFLRTEN